LMATKSLLTSSQEGLALMGSEAKAMRTVITATGSLIF
jgi:hypothetical protein